MRERAEAAKPETRMGSPLVMAGILVLVHTLAGLALEDPWFRVGLLDVFVLTLAWRGWPVRELLRPRAPLFALAIGLGLAAFTRAAGALVFDLVVAHAPELAAGVAEVQGWSERIGMGAALPLIVLTVLCEELAFRGAIALPLVERIGPWRAGVVATLAYAAAHLFAGPSILLVAALGAGGLWTALAIWRGNLFAAFVCHLAWDLAVFWLFPYG